MSSYAHSASPDALAEPRGEGVIGVLKRWWVAYMARRLEAAAIARLGSMSDRELSDIGLVRSNIVPAVRGHARG